MKFNCLSPLTTLVFYDFPMQMHAGEIERIVLDDGDTFDGTPAQFADSFFSNVGYHEIVYWAKQIGAKAEFFGTDWIITCIDFSEDPVHDTWLIFSVQKADLQEYCRAELTLLQLMERAQKMFKYEGNEFGSIEAEPIRFEDLQPEHRPTEDSFLLGTEVIDMPDPMQPVPTGVA